MGALGPMLGTSGGAFGSGIGKPQFANIQKGVTTDQANAAQAASMGSLASQNDLLAALQGQGGLNQQTDAFQANQALAGQLAGNNGAANAAAAMQGQTGLTNQLAGANGVGAQTAALQGQGAFNQQLAGANGVGTQNAAIRGLQNVAAQQQGTAGMYQNIANGTGPNPAQAALNQATGQNVANQAALMAGQRGAGANVGLQARQAAQQGANIQQQAVGQSATMQANQQLAGIQGLAAQQQAMGNTQQAIGGLGTTQAGMQQAGLGAQAQMGAGLTNQQQAAIAQQAQQANAQISQQQAANQAVANQANQVAAQQIAQTNAGTAAQQAQQQMILQGLGGINQANVGMQGNVNQANAAMVVGNQKNQGNMIGGLMNGAASAAGMGGGSKPDTTGPSGSKGPGQANTESADNGGTGSGENTSDSSSGQAPQEGSNESDGGSNVVGYAADGGMVQPPVVQQPTAPQPGAVAPAQPVGPQSSFAKFLTGFGGGGADKDDKLYSGASGLVSALGERAKSFSGGGLAATGGHVAAKSPGQKAEKSGNSYDNDKVPAMLSENEIVIPRSITQSADPVRGAADFVAKIMAKKGRK